MPEKQPPTSSEDIPHYSGHRDRLRVRFITSGADSFQDYELLEMLLFTAIPRRDVKPLAKSLLIQFGGLSGVMQATVRELQQVEGLSENSAVMLKTIQALTKKMLKNDIVQKPILSSWQKLLDYCHVSMAHEMREQFRVFFLNRKNQLIADEVQQIGTVDHTPVYPREIIRRALELGATALILAHNHPSGDPTPSDADIAMTEEIMRAATALEITIHDHLIIARDRHVSFKSLGLLNYMG
jgi:DNA repair protein RadC